MRAYLATNLLGSFVFDKSEKLIAYTLFPKKPEDIVKEVAKVEAGKVLDQEKELVSNLKKLGYKEVICDRDVGSSDIICLIEKDNLGKETLQSGFRKLAMDLHWVSSQSELNEILTKVNVLKTKEKLKVVKSDKILIHAISVLDELEKNINTLAEHLKEWYGLYFPEAIKLMKTNEKITDLIYKFTDRNTIKQKYSGDAKNLPKYAENSAGMEFSAIDLGMVRMFSENISSLFKLRDELTQYIQKSAQEVIPNMSCIVGHVMASRMLAAAGSLEKISRMPSSTVQLLGAEKALFRHLREGSKAPKYGILFGESHIQNAPNELRGKIARLIASKLSLAAKTDFFSGEDKSEYYKKQFEEQLTRIIKPKTQAN